MIRIDIYLSNNEVMVISEALKTINVGGPTVIKKRGRGQNPPPEIHAGKGIGSVNVPSTTPVSAVRGVN